MTRTLVVVTTYNELENLPALVEEIFAARRRATCWSSTTIRPTAPALGPRARAPANRG